MKREEARKLLVRHGELFMLRRDDEMQEYKQLSEKLIAALTTKENQPEGRAIYDLTVRVGIDGNGKSYIYEGKYAGSDIGDAKDITGHWQKVGK